MPVISSNALVSTSDSYPGGGGGEPAPEAIGGDLLLAHQGHSHATLALREHGGRSASRAPTIAHARCERTATSARRGANTTLTKWSALGRPGRTKHACVNA